MISSPLPPHDFLGHDFVYLSYIMISSPLPPHDFQGHDFVYLSYIMISSPLPPHDFRGHDFVYLSYILISSPLPLWNLGENLSKSSYQVHAFSYMHVVSYAIVSDQNDCQDLLETLDMVNL